MIIYLLDTDHITLAQHNHPNIAKHILATSPAQLRVSVVTAHEQMRGRLAQVQRAKNNNQLIYTYQLLHQTIKFYHTIPMIDFDTKAATIFEQLNQHKIRIGTLDLRIASIALAVGAILVTRNQKDFKKVPNLIIEDWSQP